MGIWGEYLNFGRPARDAPIPKGLHHSAQGCVRPRSAFPTAEVLLTKGVHEGGRNDLPWVEQFYSFEPGKGSIEGAKDISKRLES